MTSTQPHGSVVAQTGGHCVCEQEQVSGGTTSTVLRNLLSDTPYKVTVVPVYPEGEGLRQTDRGKTRELDCFSAQQHPLSGQHKLPASQKSQTNTNTVLLVVSSIEKMS